MIAGASDSALDIAPDLEIDLSSATTRSTGPASRRQVLSLIAELLDDRQFHQNLILAFYVERLFDYDAMVNYAGFHPGQNHLVMQFMQPKFDLTAVQLMRLETTEAQACAQLDYPDVMARMPMVKQDSSLMSSIDQLLGLKQPYSMDRTIKVHFNILTVRRAAAIALAVRLWQVDHAGKFPPNLQALVPAYLPAIPIDPFAKGQSPLRYKSDTPAGPIIYSVGENGVDDGGSTTPLPGLSQHISQNDRDDRLDIVYPLRPSPPSTDPGGNN
jgi:hypothetical protein